MKNKVSYKWSNYFRATPTNLKAAVNAVKGLIVLLAATDHFANNDKYAFWMLIGGFVLDQLAKFFGYVEEQTMTTTIEYPASVADQVTVKTTETKNE